MTSITKRDHQREDWLFLYSYSKCSSSVSSGPIEAGSPEPPSAQTPAGPPTATIPRSDPDLPLTCSRSSGGRWRAPRPAAAAPPPARVSLPVLTGNRQRHHAAGGPGRITGPAGGKGGTGEPEPGLNGADCQTLLQGLWCSPTVVTVGSSAPRLPSD